MNPYQVAFSLFLKRLIWDVSPVSWYSRRRIRRLRNQFVGEKAVILCNGPSLADVDFNLLGDLYTFGLNKINLLFEEKSFRPSSIVAVNKYVIDQNSYFYSSTDIPLFLDSHAANNAEIPIRKSITLIHTADVPSFSGDCSMSIFQGYTVTYVAFQLAYHMGFKSVALLGCDHHFASQGAENSLINANGPDYSHFHKEYFSKGQKWQLPDLHQSETYYKLALRYYNKDGRGIFNATENSKLTIFPKISITKFLSY